MSADFFRDYLAAWGSHDPERVMAFFTDDVVFEDTTLGHRVAGRRQMRRFVEASFREMPGVTFDHVSRLSTGEEYALEWVMQPAGIRGASIGKLRDGRICEHRDYWNGARLQEPDG